MPAPPSGFKLQRPVVSPPITAAPSLPSPPPSAPSPRACCRLTTHPAACASRAGPGGQFVQRADAQRPRRRRQQAAGRDRHPGGCRPLHRPGRAAAAARARAQRRWVHTVCTVCVGRGGVCVGGGWGWRCVAREGGAGGMAQEQLGAWQVTGKGPSVLRSLQPTTCQLAPAYPSRPASCAQTYIPMLPRPPSRRQLPPRRAAVPAAPDGRPALQHLQLGRLQHPHRQPQRQQRHQRHERGAVHRRAAAAPGHQARQQPRGDAGVSAGPWARRAFICRRMHARVQALQRLPASMRPSQGSAALATAVALTLTLRQRAPRPPARRSPAAGRRPHAQRVASGPCTARVCNAYTHANLPDLDSAADVRCDAPACAAGRRRRARPLWPRPRAGQGPPAAAAPAQPLPAAQGWPP